MYLYTVTALILIVQVKKKRKVDRYEVRDLFEDYNIITKATMRVYILQCVPYSHSK